MIDTIIKIFMPIIMGYAFVKIGYLNKSIGSDLNLFAIRVTVPLQIFISMYNTNLDTLEQLIPVTGAFVMLTSMLIIVSFTILSKMKNRKLKAAYIIAIVYGNYGWMGWAVLHGAFGEAGLSRGVFFTSLWWPVIYIGSYLIARLSKVNSELDVKNFMINMTVPLFALIAGVILNISGIEIYDPLLYTIDKFGSMTVTIILFGVGLSISIRNSLRGIKDSLIPIILRPVLGIICAFVVVNIIGFNDIITRKSILIESTMPVAVFTVVLADMLGLDSKLMSSILVLSTLFSLITIPITLYFIA